MGEVKLIKVREETWRELMHLKIDIHARSMDEVINYLLSTAGVAADAL